MIKTVFKLCFKANKMHYVVINIFVTKYNENNV